MKKILLVFFSLILAINISGQYRKKSYKHIMSSKSIYEMDAFLRDAHKDDPRREVIKPRLIKSMKKYIKNAHPADPRVKDFQKKIALLKTRNSTKITFEEISENIRKKKIEEYLAKVQAEQDNPSDNENINNTINTTIADNNTNQTSSSSGNTFTQAEQTNTYASTTSGSTTSTTSKANSTDASTQAEFTFLMNKSAKNHEKKTVKLLNKLFENDPSSKETIVLIENQSRCNIVVKMEGAGGLIYKLPVPMNKENSMVVLKGSYLFSSIVCGATYASQKTVKKSLMITLNNP